MSYHVLITKKIPHDILLNYNKFNIVSIDFIRITENISNQKILHNSWIFTSKNGFEFANNQYQLPTTNTNIYCVGKTTEQLILAAGHTVSACANSAAELLSMLPKNNQYTLFCSQQRLNTLPNALQNNLQEIHVYKTQLLYPKLKSDFDAYAFFSPSAVKSYFKYNQIPTKSISFAIGYSTAKCLKDHGAKNIITAKKPSIKAVLTLMKNHLNEE